MDRRIPLAVFVVLLLANAGTAGAQSRADSVPPRPREGSRVRVERPDGTVIEGWTDPRPAPGSPPVTPRYQAPMDANDGRPLLDAWGDPIAVWCPGDTDPVLVPGWDVVSLEVYEPPRSRMDYYTGIGAAVGLATGLLLALPDMSSTGTNTWSLGDRGFVRLAASIALGIGAGGIAGMVAEGHGVWKPVAVAWSPTERAPQVQVAFSF